MTIIRTLTDVAATAFLVPFMSAIIYTVTGHWPARTWWPLAYCGCILLSATSPIGTAGITGQLISALAVVTWWWRRSPTRRLISPP